MGDNDGDTIAVAAKVARARKQEFYETKARVVSSLLYARDS
jgi:hypothetical protein